MSHVEEAVRLFKNDFNCSQSVLAAFAPELGLDQGKALRLACGFGAGMGCTGRTCGAVTGAFMVIGLKYGKDKAGDKASKPATYKKINEFIAEFENIHGSTECRQLIGMDVSTEQGMAQARKRGIFKDVCYKIVQDAVTLLEEQFL